MPPCALSGVFEKTVKLGYRFRAPKTKHGRRTISLPPSAIPVLREHHKQQLELRVKLGLGKLDHDALVFCRHDGSNLVSNTVTRNWHEAMAGGWKFHGCCHTHASALIADRIDPVTIAARLGHSSRTITMKIYAHLFHKTDTTAADAIEKLLGANRVPKGSSSLEAQGLCEGIANLYGLTRPEGPVAPLRL